MTVFCFLGEGHIHSRRVRNYTAAIIYGTRLLQYDKEKRKNYIKNTQKTVTMQCKYTYPVLHLKADHHWPAS